MSPTPPVGPCVLHDTPGRLRVHLPEWSGQGARQLERRLRQTAGVRRVEASAVTGNILICYAPTATGPAALLAGLRGLERATADAPPDEPAPPPVLTESRQGTQQRARIAVRGLDRDPALGRRVVDVLQRHPGVRARASALTGRVLVEFDAHLTDLKELLGEVADVELPDLPGEDRPAHPLDPAPLVTGATRTIGVSLGLGLLVLRRLTGGTGRPAGARTAATLAGVLGILRGYPTIRGGLRRLLGANAADLVFSSASIVTLALAGSPLGLAVTGVEGVILLREVLARRAAWRRYEERLGGAADAEPGAVIRLEAGERAPRSAEVVEGSGTAVGRNGLPWRWSPAAWSRPARACSAGPSWCSSREAGRLFPIRALRHRPRPSTSAMSAPWAPYRWPTPG